jgi:hypothetical protein
MKAPFKLLLLVAAALGAFVWWKKNNPGPNRVVGGVGFGPELDDTTPPDLGL